MMGIYCQHCGDEVKDNDGTKVYTGDINEDENEERIFHYSCLYEEIPRCMDARENLLGEYKHVLVVAVNVRFLYGTSSKAAITKRDRKIKRDRKLLEIIKVVSAVRNSGGGCVLIQLLGKNPDDTYTGALDEFLDSKLTTLLHDGELFTDVFVKKTLDEIVKWSNFHDMIVLSVEASSRMITTDIKTKISLDDAINTPSINEFVRLVRKGRMFPTVHPKKIEPTKLTSLHESRCVQLKGSSFQKEPCDEQLFQDLFEKLRLHEYVSAFSKLKDGGSYFLGVAEVETHSGHYISKRADVQGIILNESDESIVSSTIISRLKEQILICDYDGNELHAYKDLIKVYAIPVEKSEKRFVLQISVSPMYGIIFCDKSGPLAYTVATTIDVKQSERLERIPLRIWFHRMRSALDVDLKNTFSSVHSKTTLLPSSWLSPNLSNQQSETISGHEYTGYIQKLNIANALDDDIEVDGVEPQVSLSKKEETVQPPVKRKADNLYEKGKRFAQGHPGSRLPSSTEVISTYQYHERKDTDDIQLKSNPVTHRCTIKVHYKRKILRPKSLSGGRIRNCLKYESSQKISEVKIEEIRKRTESRIEDGINVTAVKKRTIKSIAEKLKETKWVTIKGTPGAGKTTVAYMVLDELNKAGKEVFQVISPEEFSEVTSTCSQPVIMFDDILGKGEFNHGEWLIWKPVLNQMWIEKYSRPKNETAVVTKDVSVIFVARDHILKSDSLKTVGNFCSAHEVHVVDMSSSLDKVMMEKPKEVKMLSDSSTSCSSELLVRQFALTMPQEYAILSREDIFRHPLEFLKQSIQKLMLNNGNLIIFKEMIKMNGKAELHKLINAEGSQTVKDTLDGLVGTYLAKDGDSLTFVHSSIYESVSICLCKQHPLYVIENCNISFIRERLRLETSHVLHDIPDKGPTFVVYISKSYASNLAKRFAAEISNGNILQVLSHSALSDDHFIKEMMSYTTIKLSQLGQLKDLTTGKNFFTLLASSRSSQLLRYIENHTDIQLKEINVIDVFHGVCQYAATDVLKYLMQITKQINMNVRHGTMKQTPLMIATETQDSNFVQQIMSLSFDIDMCDVSGKTTVHYLSKNGLVSPLEQVLDRGADIDVKDFIGQSPLWWACWANHIEVMSLLLDRGADTDHKVLDLACEKNNMQILTCLFKKGMSVHTARSCDEIFNLACKTDHQGISVNKTDLMNGRTLVHIAAERNQELLNLLLKTDTFVNVLSRYGETPLHRAASSGSYECIQILLDHCADVNVQSKDGLTPLHEAVKLGSKECANLLLESGADPNVQSNVGYTPLHKAAENGFQECVELLLKADADSNIVAKDGYTPLHKAAERNSKLCVDMLLKAGADMNAYSEDGDTPMHKAAEKDCTESLDLLLTSSADANIKNIHGDTLLHKAVGKEAKCCVDLLLKAGADVNFLSKTGDSPLQRAVEKGSVFCVDILLKAGSNVNFQGPYGYTPLHTASERRSKRCFTLLLNAGADVKIQTKDGKTPLHIAIERECDEFILLLLKACADIHIRSNDGETPLHKAAKKGSTKFVDLLLNHGADVNVQDKLGDTSLHKAGWKRARGCVDRLLKAGADLSVHNLDGDTSLHTAIEGGSKRCVHSLLNSGADVNSLGSYGYTPLHTAVEKGFEHCINMLLKERANVNVQCQHGYTPLHLAVRGGLMKSADLLLKAGADVDVKSKCGDCPLYIASGKHSKECFELLLKAGANVNAQRADGNTPLHRAALRESKEFIHLLLTAGAKVDSRNMNGQTPLHMAVVKESNCISVFLMAHADVNVRTIVGNTPLHIAAENGSKESLEALLTFGADINVQNRDGQTPLHYAVKEGSQKCVSMLMMAGADVNIPNKDGNTPLHEAVEGSQECIKTLVMTAADVNKDSITLHHDAVKEGSQVAGANANVF